MFVNERPRQADSILLHTTAGPVEYSQCPICQSVRLKDANGTTSYPLKKSGFARCQHTWLGGFSAWSDKKLAPGDVLLIRKSGHYSAVRVIATSGAGSSITFDWFYQPDKSKGTFADTNVQKGAVTSTGRIAFKDVSIEYQARRIWYDFYYGGIDPPRPNYYSPQEIAFAGNVDVKAIDASDPGWIYKTWEDGKPNGYRTPGASTQPSTRPVGSPSTTRATTSVTATRSGTRSIM
jgi:hypothetical protein